MGQNADIDTRLDDKLSKLVIADVVEEDSGEYSCEAHNRAGIVAYSTVTIYVKRKLTSLYCNKKVARYDCGTIITSIILILLFYVYYCHFVTDPDYF